MHISSQHVSLVLPMCGGVWGTWYNCLHYLRLGHSVSASTAVAVSWCGVNPVQCMPAHMHMHMEELTCMHASLLRASLVHCSPSACLHRATGLPALLTYAVAPILGRHCLAIRATFAFQAAWGAVTRLSLGEQPGLLFSCAVCCDSGLGWVLR